MNTTTEELLEKTPIWKPVLRLEIPAMFGQFLNLLYSIVDRVFVARIPGTGEMALAAIGVCAAVVQSFMTVVFCPAQGITTGCGTIFSYHCGGEMIPKSVRRFLACFFYAALISVFYKPQFKYFHKCLED